MPSENKRVAAGAGADKARALPQPVGAGLRGQAGWSLGRSKLLDGRTNEEWRSGQTVMRWMCQGELALCSAGRAAPHYGHHPTPARRYRGLTYGTCCPPWPLDVSASPCFCVSLTVSAVPRARARLGLWEGASPQVPVGEDRLALERRPDAVGWCAPLFNHGACI
jgi:hypothetical protein